MPTTGRAPTTPGRTIATEAMVATPHPLATQAGLALLREGGTAVDAAVAANAVLTVVYPDQTAIGGDAFLLHHEAATGQLHGLNGSGRAPAAADRAALRAAGWSAIPRLGIHAVTVPGTVDAWDAALRRFGRFGLDRVLAPAVRLADEGFPVSPRLARAMAAARPILESDPGLAAAFLPGGVPPAAGDKLLLPDLARTLSLLARDGRDAFYTGPIAGAIAATSRRLGGPLVADDLARHRAEWVEPLTGDYRGLTVAQLPPNSQGFTALLALNLVEAEDLGPEWGTAAHLHPLIEAKQLAFAVRDRVLADPAFAPLDTAALTSKPFARDLWRRYDPDRAGPGTPTRPGDTVAICAVDRDGNAVSLIQSIYTAFGSGVLVQGTGVVLQNRGVSFRLDDDHPNRLEPGKRPAHTLMPAMLLRAGRLLGPLATQGGDAQAQVHLQLVTDLVDFGMDPRAAVDAPRWVAGGPADPTLLLEGRFPPATAAGLRARGHAVAVVEDWHPHAGHAQLILRDETTGTLHGAADRRADGLALGY